jgi:predicted RND superfamily exporter protein
MNDCDLTNGKTATPENQKKCENLIVKTLNEFNNTFKTYESNYLTYKNTPSSVNTESELRREYSSMQDKLREIKGLVDKYTNNFLKTGTTTQDSQNFYNEILEKYNRMIESRKKLDQQLYDLYTNDYESVYSNKPFVDSTVVTGIIWTILVTFMLYYIIVKM